ncbi:MAG: type II toxin-antitoxin system Phd/YefM family antitoxin [Gammaproteobacteria bacterium]|nr:type II toxin-antitoxin system Phd/YefM family antitoxin [Gammaproteobacteria bacterium]MBU1442191.1 type II toxin-antitoxin system Phd/YefM family antitoxin [Gammaproteobacteria bacterium]MBU2410687.1 type II toxin-antitoxin system Phd/YefM family antitoxin [Gammaproteobacteria bacterium]
MDRLKRDLSSVSATHLAAGMQNVTRTVLSEGAVVITRHDKPAMVLMSVERYLKLEQAAEPQLDALTRKFEDLFARMQGDAAAQAMAGAFAMTPQQLGEAAAEAADASGRAPAKPPARTAAGKTTGA